MKQKSLQQTAPPADLETVANRASHSRCLGKVSASAFGLKDGKAALQIVMQALNVPSCGASKDESDRLITAFGTLIEIGPKGATESLLAVQMMGVHNAALMFLPMPPRTDKISRYVTQTCSGPSALCGHS